MNRLSIATLGIFITSIYANIRLSDQTSDTRISVNDNQFKVNQSDLYSDNLSNQPITVPTSTVNIIITHDTSQIKISTNTTSMTPSSITKQTVIRGNFLFLFILN